MSANKNDSKTKVHQDDNTDSGCISGPIDQWPDEEPVESKQERKPEDSGLSEDYNSGRITKAKEENVTIDSGICDDYISGRITKAKEENVAIDSGICYVSGPITEGLTCLNLIDTSIPTTGHFTCKVTAPEQKDIPLAHLLEFFMPDDEGDTQVHIASVHGCEKSLATLIRLCPNKTLLDLTNDQGQTPLHLAVLSGNAVVTRMLVLAGLSLEVRDSNGETPLHIASAAGLVECLLVLLTPVPEYSSRQLAAVLNQKNYNGQACVHLAASAGHLEVLQTLVAYGADINAVENLAGWTALHIASRRGDIRMVQYLRERRVGARINLRDYGGRTPRRLARYTPAARLFTHEDDTDDDSDTDDDDYDSDNESLFERLRDNLSSINVA